MKTSNSVGQSRLWCYNCGLWLDEKVSRKHSKNGSRSLKRTRRGPRNSKQKSKMKDIEIQAQKLEEAVDEVKRQLAKNGQVATEVELTSEANESILPLGQTPTYKVSDINTVHWENLIMIQPEDYSDSPPPYNLRSNARKFKTTSHLPATSGLNQSDLDPLFLDQVDNLLRKAREASDKSTNVLKAQF